jgi:hypothetical protein
MDRVTSRVEQRRIRAWMGDRESLVQLGERIEQQFSDGLSSAVSTSDRGQAGSRRSGWLKNVLRLLGLAKQQPRSSQVQVEVQTKRDVKKGDYHALLQNEKVEIENATQIRFACEFGERSCLINLSKAAGTEGSLLRVSGDPLWVHATMDELTDQLARRKPAWSIVRHPAVVTVAFFALFVILFVLAAYVLSGPLYDWLDSRKWPDLVSVVLETSFSVAILGLASALPWLIVNTVGARIVPPLEITKPGGISARQRVWRAVAISSTGVVSLVAFLQALAWLRESIS